MNKTRLKQAGVLRSFRKIHRYTGALLFGFFFVISITGLLLGWKKNSGDYLLPKTYRGTSTNLAQWVSVDSLHRQALIYFRDSIDANITPTLERIDIRAEKGVAKFVFEEYFSGLQLDGATAKLLHIDKRRSDFVEKLHDGSILDLYFKTSGGQIKLIYTTIMGIALLVFTITGNRFLRG
ncbi:MAG: PepSY domain-containing protein, partial [Chitinophagaceae bacterium]